MELKLQSPLKLGELATEIGAQLSADGAAESQTEVSHLSSLDSAVRGSVSFLSNSIYKKYLATTQASAVILTPADAKFCTVPALITPNPRLALAKLLSLCSPTQHALNTQGVHPSAVVDNNVKLGINVTIGANCFIGNNCEISDNTVIMPNVVLYPRTKIGMNCIIHSGAVIGADGFGYAVDASGNWVKMPHLGGVVIGDFVEIGCNTTIDRGMIDNTVIGNRVVIDNQVQIGHNVTIGDNTAIAGCAGIAGSTTIGKYCLIGGAACIAGHIEIADRVHISGTTSVSHSITQQGVYSSGLPARENSVWRRSVARFNNLDNIVKRIQALEKSSNKVVATVSNINDGFTQ